MARSIITSPRLLALVIILTLAAVLLPDRWLGWTRLPGEIVRIALGPFGHGLNAAANWLRPPPSTQPDLRGISPEYVRRLEEDKEEFHRLWVIEQNRSKDLQEQLRQAHAIVEEMPDISMKQVRAAVVIRAPGASLGPVTLNRGERDGVSVGAIAMHNGQVLGRVTSTSRVQSTLVPLPSRDNKWILAVIKPADKPKAPLNTLPVLQFQSLGDGTLAADADKSFVISVGDSVLLLDPSWPALAQGRTIGVVESARVKDADPLRNVVKVRPKYQVAEITNLMLIIEEDQSAGGNSGGAP